MKGFKAYDIRGIFNQDFTAEDVYKIGFFLPKLLRAESILVGRDVRISSEEIYNALCKGINDFGAEVYDAGPATTPMVYWGTAKYNFPGSVQITASHNPPEYNGLKISKSGALPVGYESGLAELEEYVHTENVRPVTCKGSINPYEILHEYVRFLQQWIDFSDITMAIDCSNGMASLLVRNIFGDTPEYLYEELDGSFPNHEPNPLEPENIKDLQRCVREKNVDIGIIFDGDADRVMFVDETGNFISPDLMIGLLGHYYLEREKGPVLHDIRTSRGVAEYIKTLGGIPHMWKVGHAYAKVKMREIRAIYGGELAGHYYFRDFYNCDSGMLSAILVLNVVSKMKKKGKTVSELVNAINPYAYSGEINFRIEQKQEAMEALRSVFTDREEPRELYDFDGYRIEFTDWWFNVRPSNTEPYLRLVVEGKNENVMSEKLNEIKEVLGDFEG